MARCLSFVVAVGVAVVAMLCGAGVGASAGAAPPHPYRIVVIGDSITGGSNEGGVGPFGWPEITWNSLRAQGIDVDPAVSGEGGAGYVQPGLGGTTFGEEAARLVTPDDNVVLFFGSRNDGAQPIDAVSAASHQAFADVRRVAPAAKLVVIGPIWPDPDPPAAVLAIRDTLRQQATDAKAIWVDPIAQGWLTAPGSIGSDDVHPTNAGHAEMAGRIEAVIKSALGI